MKSIIPFILYCLVLLPFNISAQDDDGLKWFVIGEDYRSKAQYVQALSAYTKAVEKNSEAHRYLFGKAQCQYQLKMKSDA